MSASALIEAMQRKEASAEEVTRSVLKRITDTDEALHCYITVNEEQALATAKKVDARRARGENLGVLAGVPVAIKDDICTEGLLTTCGSRHLSNFIPPYNATVVQRLLDADAIIIGKSNMDEFGLGSSTENSGFFATHNPWDVARVPGGSSGGSAAALASGQAALALGTDTGGSIRQPAAFCGVVGLKPTYGRVSRYGMVATASSLDQIGPLASNVDDCALLLQVLAGSDALDSTCIPGAPPSYQAEMSKGVEGMVVGLPREYFTTAGDSGVREAVMAAVKVLQELGALVQEVSLPHTEYALAAYQVIAACEGSSNLARYDGVRYGYRSQVAPDSVAMFSNTRAESFGSETKRRIILGTYALSAGSYETYYIKATQVRTLVKQDFEQAFKSCDLLVTPTVPTIAFQLGQKVDDPMVMYQNNAYTLSANLAGLPAISVPCGLHQGLPVGLQLIGPSLQEGRLLGAAAAYERAAQALPPCPGRRLAK